MTGGVVGEVVGSSFSVTRKNCSFVVDGSRLVVLISTYQY